MSEHEAAAPTPEQPAPVTVDVAAAEQSAAKPAADDATPRKRRTPSPRAPKADGDDTESEPEKQPKKRAKTAYKGAKRGPKPGRKKKAPEPEPDEREAQKDVERRVDALSADVKSRFGQIVWAKMGGYPSWTRTTADGTCDLCAARPFPTRRLCRGTTPSSTIGMEIKLPIEERADGLLKPDKSDTADEQAVETPPPVKRKPGRPPKAKTAAAAAAKAALKKTPKKRQAKGEGETGQASDDKAAAAQEEEDDAAGPTLSKEEIKAKVAIRKTPSKKKAGDESAAAAGAAAKKAPKATTKHTKANGSEIDSKRKKEIELVVPHKSVKSADIREMTEEAAKKKLSGPKTKAKKDKGDYKVGDLSSFAIKMTRLHAKESTRNNDELVAMMQELFKEKLMYRSDVERSGLAAIIATLRKSSNPTVGQTASALRKHMMKILNNDTFITNLGKKSQHDGAGHGTKKRKSENGSSTKSEEQKPKSDTDSLSPAAATSDGKEKTDAKENSAPEREKATPPASASPTKKTEDKPSKHASSKDTEVKSKEEQTPSKPAEDVAKKDEPAKAAPSEDAPSKVAVAKSEETAEKVKPETDKPSASPTKVVDKPADGAVKDKDDIFEAPEHMDKNRKIFVDMLGKILEYNGAERTDLATEIEVAMFERFKDSNDDYLTQARIIIFGLKDNSSMRDRLFSGALHCLELALSLPQSQVPPVGSMARANLLLSAGLERAFADAQSGKLRFVKVSIEGESFVLSGSAPATAEPRDDVAQLLATHLSAEQAAFVLLCPDTNVAALRWVLLAFVPEGVSVRDRMLYSSSRDSLKKQLGLNYFSGEFHATELVGAALKAVG
ncbi:unnamed protein product [Phytophthora lilii]|uniref:Unnamed protein product n=1 Tax=Phytophthora lilii TaxID=2077276 RepID=A0A9W6TPR1_9STRA|nr:unnamed protein product [Phytophthora lilii]